jgi:hypothetical protein
MNDYVNFSIFVASAVALGIFTLYNFQKIKNNDLFRSYMRTKAIFSLGGIVLVFLVLGTIGKK